MPLNVDRISTGSLSVNGTDITGNALQTVAVDGVTITGDGTLGDPLVAVPLGPAYKVYTAYIEMGSGNVLKLFQNTLGVTLTWGVVTTGIISAGNSGSLVGQTKVYISVSSRVDGVSPKIVSGSFFDNPWSVQIRQTDNAGVLDGTQSVYVEIRVYN
jgi:hypothetical protein